MRKAVSFALAVVMVFTLSVPALAHEQGNSFVVDTSSEHVYYDTELRANVIAFTCNADGTVNYLTKNEADAITNNTTDLVSLDHGLRRVENGSSTCDVSPSGDYYQYYRFKQIGGAVKYTGSMKKVSQDIEAPAGGAQISKSVSATSTHYFSASVNTSDKKAAVQAGATIGWQSSASVTTTFTFNLLPGQKGYIGFYPYYNRVYGDLELHGNWGDGLISTTQVYGYSVKLNDSGEADGLFKLILI